MGKRDLPEVADSYLEGAKEEDAPEEKDKRETLKDELELHLAEPTFGVFNVFRYSLN